jgi:Glycosyl transferase family 2
MSSPRSSPGNSQVPTFGIVISTVGRWDRVSQVLDDLANQSTPPRTVALAYENTAAPGLDNLLERFADRLRLRPAVKSGGYSIGCNTAVAMLDGDVEWICLLTDSCRVDPDFLQRLSEYCVAPATVCAMRLVDAEGDRNKLPPRGSKLTRRNVWSVAVPGMVVRHRDYLKVGGFDATIGTGADSPWQSGDETDLLLKLSLLDDFAIDWVDDITVHGHTDFSHLTPAERRRKLRSYGRGTGYIHRRWNYPVRDKLRHLAGAASLPFRDHTKYRTTDALALLIGRFEGLLGKKLSLNSDHRAVIR